MNRSQIIKIIDDFQSLVILAKGLAEEWPMNISGSSEVVIALFYLTVLMDSAGCEPTTMEDRQDILLFFGNPESSRNERLFHAIDFYGKQKYKSGWITSPCGRIIRRYIKALNNKRVKRQRPNISTGQVSRSSL